MLEGTLIAIEGIDGAGKTTQARLLAEALERAGYTVTRSKEPTDGPWGQKIRATASTGRLPVEEELQLFMADRREHVARLLQPSLAAGHVVLVDRYYYSSAAYQGARGLHWRDVIQQNEAFAPRPDIVLLLDCDPGVGRDRIAARGDEANEFEGHAALALVRKVFDQMVCPEPVMAPLKMINADRPVNVVHRQALRLLRDLAAKRSGVQAPNLFSAELGPPVPDEEIQEEAFLLSALR